MVQIFRTNSCCGVREIGNLNAKGSDIVRIMWNGIAHQSPNLDGAFWWWGDNVGSGNGRKLARYFNKYSLGEIIEVPQTHNPQSGHELEMWVLVLDHEKLREWIDRYGE